MTDLSPDCMRYRDTGNVHRDFHKLLNATIDFIVREHGVDALDATFRRLAHDVYRSIHEDLQAGDWRQLLRHWVYCMQREEGEVKLIENGDSATLHVHACPAIRYLQSEGVAVSEHFCRQTIVMNNALAAGTPFTIETRVLDTGVCQQCIRRRADDSQ